RPQGPCPAACARRRPRRERSDGRSERLLHDDGRHRAAADGRPPVLAAAGAVPKLLPHGVRGRPGEVLARHAGLPARRPDGRPAWPGGLRAGGPLRGHPRLPNVVPREHVPGVPAGGPAVPPGPAHAADGDGGAVAV
ncbi:unnamed protein product, partial [Prorocentrum cordatum]